MGESVRLDDKFVWEIRVKWNDTVMDVLELRPGAGDGFSFSIGEDPACDYPVDASWIAGESRFELLQRDDDGRARLRSPSGGRGFLIPRQGERKTFGGMILAGQVEKCPEYLDAHLFELDDAIEATLEVGPWVFEIRRGIAEDQVTGAFRVDRRSFIFPGASLLVHGIFFFLIYLIPPQSKAFQFDPLDGKNRYVNAMLLVPPKIVEVPALQKDQTKQKEEPVDKVAKGKQSASQNKGAGGSDQPKKPTLEEIATGGKDGLAGPQVDKQSIGSMGVAGVIASVAGSLFGSASAFSGDPENVLDNLNPGGAGMPCIGVMCARGTGRGGGEYEGGDISGRGVWANTGPGSGFKGPPNVGPLGPRQPDKSGPTIVSRGVETKGSISKDQVRRIVHRHLPEIKHCYNRGLISRPELAGRVVVKFVVSGKGLVMQSAVSQTSLGDPKVERCIADAVRRWTFPIPRDGGVVVVNYPFQLNSQ